MTSSEILIALFALFFSLVSMALQYTVGNRRRVQAIQKEMKTIQDEVQKASKEKDEQKLKRLQGDQSRMMDLMMGAMQLQFKPTLLILPLVIILYGGFGYGGVLLSWFPDFSISLPIALHLTGDELFGLNILHSSVYGVRGFF